MPASLMQALDCPTSFYPLEKWDPTHPWHSLGSNKTNGCPAMMQAHKDLIARDEADIKGGILSHIYPFRVWNYYTYS